MQISFNLYDLIGYILPGVVMIVVVLMLINPDILVYPPDDPEKGLAQYLPTTVVQGILCGLTAYFLGFLLRGCTDAFFKFVPQWAWFKRLNMYNHSGWFMKWLFEPNDRDPFGDSNPYSDQFIHELKNQIEEIFAIRVDSLERDSEYMEIFDFCRHTLMNQSAATYARVLMWFSRYESARLMMSVSFLATLGFFAQGIHLWNTPESAKWFIFVLAGTSLLLTVPFFLMSKRLLGYYRKTILYGFYEYAVTREKPRDSENLKNELA